MNKRSATTIAQPKQDTLLNRSAVRPVRICHLTSVHLPFDTRIFHKECVFLANSGFEVFLVAPHDRNETCARVEIVGIKRREHRLLRMTQSVYAVYKAALKINARLYHFHDPELICIALLLKLRRKKIIFDVHEDYPADILSKTWLRHEIIRRVVAAVVVWLEKFAGFLCNGIVTVTPELAQRFPVSKTAVVHNFPMIDLFDRTYGREIVKSSATPKFIFAGGHAWGLTRDRCIKEIVHAIGLLEPDKQLWLIGNWESRSFQAECELVKGFEYCKCLGYLPLATVYGYMKSADVGLALFRPEKGLMRCIPTKAFEYMTASLPMIMSDFPFWRKMFGECALFADPLDPNDIAEKMTVLANDIELRHRLGSAGRRLVENNFSWETERVKLDRLYRRLLHIDSETG